MSVYLSRSHCCFRMTKWKWMIKMLKSPCAVRKLSVLTRVVTLAYRTSVLMIFLWFLSTSLMALFHWLCASACLVALFGCRWACICVKVVRVRQHHVKVYEVSIVWFFFLLSFIYSIQTYWACSLHKQTLIA